MGFTLADFLRSPRPQIESTENYNIFELPEGDSAELGISCLIFQLGLSLYAISSHAVLTISQPQTISSIPFLRNDFCKGFIAFNGSAVPVANIYRMLAIDSGISTTNSSRLIVIRHQSYLTAIPAESVQGVVKVATTEEFKQVGQLNLMATKLGQKPVAIVDETQITQMLGEVTL